MNDDQSYHRVWISEQPNTQLTPDGVQAERNRQLAKWGVQHQSPEMWALILTEEVGEFAQAILDLKVHIDRGGTTSVPFDHMRDELVQCAAVCLSALADFDGHPEWRTADYWPGVPVGADPVRWWEPRTYDPPARDIGPFVRDEVKP